MSCLYYTISNSCNLLVFRLREQGIDNKRIDCIFGKYGTENNSCPGYKEKKA